MHTSCSQSVAAKFEQKKFILATGLHAETANLPAIIRLSNLTHLLVLTNTVSSSLRLLIDCRIVVCVVHDDCVCCLEIEPHTARPQAQQEHKYTRVCAYQAGGEGSRVESISSKVPCFFMVVSGLQVSAVKGKCCSFAFLCNSFVSTALKTATDVCFIHILLYVSTKNKQALLISNRTGCQPSCIS